ncbi:hypothetical protein [Streptomyces mirabilis]|uniref:hypothetical protein n=1 Tax=Streptomyces mirabilis TaxID=68239 RepID=UPI0006BAF023|nr:hypothetical protein [Streptomyces mirabilis]KPI17975.1 hypothetical protein OK006_10399 [Actinobacteria bacterium OK006]MCX4427081.1 hypothetical protein [Streptomyces mirabilis]
MAHTPPTQTGEQILASAMRTAIAHGHICVVLWSDSIEITGPDDEQIAMIPGEFATPSDLATFLGIPEADIEDTR